MFYCYNLIMQKACRVDGAPLTPEWCSNNLFPDVYEVEPVLNTWINGSHSSTVKIALKYNSNTEQPTTLYWKRVVLQDLPTKSSYKLYRDVYSYNAETMFYQHFSTNVNNAGVRVPKCYFSHAEFNKQNLNQSRFLLALEDLSGLGYKQQHVHFTKNQVETCIVQLAKLHALYWNKTDDVAKYLWPRGSYWTPDKRPENEVDILDTNWKIVCNNFKHESLFSLASIQTLGQRIAEISKQVHDKVESITPKTLIHGDFKSANIFFKEENISIIDFQWSGVGSGITDIMYLITSTFNLELGENDFQIEKEFISLYCSELAKNGVEYDEQVALQHFKWAVLDMSRVILAYFFANATPQSIEKASADPGEVAYCASIPHFLAIIRYIDQLCTDYKSTF